MTDLARLEVSLTKHNAHKVAQLLKTYPAEEILDHLSDPEVNAEKAQAVKNLSVSPEGELPAVWSKARALGGEAVDALVLAGLIFSHHKLIAAMIGAEDRSAASGRIRRDARLIGKEYTNFARICERLGFQLSVEKGENGKGVSFAFDLSKFFRIAGLGPLVGELLGLKLEAAGWEGAKALADEAITLNLHEVFGLSAPDFRDWISGDEGLAKDEAFFEEAGSDPAEGAETPEPTPFLFRPGHRKRAVRPLDRAASPQTRMTRLHNDLQNRLYDHLCAIHGAEHVGCELAAGAGASVDLVVKTAEKTIFYEIKTSGSVRTNIRQAIPQLLEYAYWPEGARADELIIVSHLPSTPSAESYLRTLAERFGLPLSYRRFDLETNRLI